MARKRRQQNPVGSFLVGCLAGGAFIAGTVGGEKPQELIEFDCSNGGIILFTPTNTIERAINGATGKNGYSHAAMLLGLTDENRQMLVVDSQPTRGVKAVPLKSYHGRQIAYIPLDDRVLAHARGAALSRLGRAYRGRPQGLTCGEFVAACMPGALQRKIKEQGNFPTPNSIAKAFNIPGGGQETVTDLARRLKF